MRRTGIAFLAIVVTGCLSACGQGEPAPQQEEPAVAAEASAPEPEAPPEEGPDPTVTDPERYTVELENERVRVLRIRYGPGESSEMHFHPRSVAVFLDPLQGRMTMPDGTSEDLSVEAGEVMWAPAGQHQPANLGEEGFELVQIELKDAEGGGEAGGEGGPDPVEIAPEHYTVDFENEDVRVVRIAYGPGESSPMHFHPDSVAVFLGPLRGEMTLPDGTTEEMAVEGGEAIWAPAGQHQPTNVGDAAFELVQIELK